MTKIKYSIFNVNSVNIIYAEMTFFSFTHQAKVAVHLANYSEECDLFFCGHAGVVVIDHEGQNSSICSKAWYQISARLGSSVKTFITKLKGQEMSYYVHSYVVFLNY